MYIMSGFPNLELELQNRDRACWPGSTRVRLGMHAGAHAQTNIAKVGPDFNESLDNSTLPIPD